MNSTTNYFWGQPRPKVNILGEISKILNFYPIDLKYEKDWYLVIEFNQPLIFEVKFILWILQISCSARRLLVTWKIEDFSGMLVSRFCYSVCLYVCLSIACRSQFKTNLHKLYKVVQVVSTEKPIDFEVKGHLDVKFLKS